MSRDKVAEVTRAILKRKHGVGCSGFLEHTSNGEIYAPFTTPKPGQRIGCRECLSTWVATPPSTAGGLPYWKPEQ